MCRWINTPSNRRDNTGNIEVSPTRPSHRLTSGSTGGDRETQLARESFSYIFCPGPDCFFNTDPVKLPAWGLMFSNNEIRIPKEIPGEYKWGIRPRFPDIWQQIQTWQRNLLIPMTFGDRRGGRVWTTHWLLARYLHLQEKVISHRDIWISHCFDWRDRVFLNLLHL